MEEPQMRQRTMVAEVPPPTSSAAVSNLRDLLTVRQEEDLHRPPGTERVPRLSLGAVIAVEKLRSPSAGGTRETSSATNVPAGGRTLLDIIRDEEQSGRRGSDHAIGSSSSSSVQKINWRAFKDRLRIRRASNGGDDRLDNISPSDSPTEDNDPAATVSGNGPSSGEPEAPPQPMRMSLMALLEQTDNQRARPGVPVSALLAEDENENEEGRPEEEEDDDDDDDDEEEEEYCGSGGGGGGGEGGGGKMYVKCCVCMVRHKGAAFIPCGHTFCRLCSRELWISRGNCPLCNGFILEILDIF